MNEKEKKELALSKVVLLVLAFIGILVVVWLAWIHPSSKSGTAVNSFASCVKAGNPVQDSYPEACIAKDGKRYTNPDQNIQRLAIKEWDTDALITGVRDAYYTYDSAAQTVTVSTKTLDATLNKIDGCASGLHEVTYERLQPGDPRDEGGIWTAASLQAEASKVDEYYYRKVSLIEAACMPDQNDSNVKTAKAIHDKISTTVFMPN